MQTSSTSVPLTVRIRGRLSELQPAMRRVGEFIVSTPSAAAGMTISVLAEATEVSETTVVRFCREIGVDGYSQLRLELATELGARNPADRKFEGSWDIVAEDTLEEALAKVTHADLYSVRDTAQALDPADLEKAAQLIIDSRRCDIFGVGASGIVAQDLQQKLSRIGMSAFCTSDLHQALVSAALCDDQCVSIAISHSGATQDTVQALEAAKEQGATAIVITDAPRSELAGVADVVLPTAALETTFRSASTGSRLAQLTVVDCLFVAVAHATFAQSMDALNRTRAVVARLRSVNR